MYGRGFSGSVTEKFGEKFVPLPFAAVFQPPNVNPGLTIVPTVGRFDSEIADKVFTIWSLVRGAELLLDVAGEPEAPFGSYVIVAVHFAYKVVLPVDE
jgi:hypothetical protein